MKDWVQAFEQSIASRIISFTSTWRRGNEGPSCTKLSCKNLIFSQYRVMVFVLKHLSFSQYGRVRSSPTMWPKFLSPAFHNLWIFSVVERCPFSMVFQPRKASRRIPFRPTLSTHSFNIWVTKSHVFLIHIHCVYVTSISKTGLGGHCLRCCRNVKN